MGKKKEKEKEKQKKPFSLYVHINKNIPTLHTIYNNTNKNH